MSLGPDLVRRALGLPRRRCAVSFEEEWVEVPDGVRLSTLHLWPHGMRRDDAPTVVMRTPYGVRRWPRETLFVGRLVAETGYHVLLQDVRGRYRSEGRFAPFLNEASDGAATLDWLSAQPWFDGRAALVGASYLAYTAWAALSAAPEVVKAVAVAVGSSDLYPVFYPGGAFSLATALDWASGVGEHENVNLRDVDLARGLAFRPVREADRVALRTLDWYREWTDHARHDGYWDAIRPTLPSRPPAVLSLAGWYDLFLGPQLEDWRTLDESARRSRDPAQGRPRLVVGPWAHGRPARWVRRGRGSGALANMLREILVFLERSLRGAGEDDRRPVRLFVLGANRWREEDRWPPADAREQAFFLRGAGAGAGGPDRAGGRLGLEAPPTAEPPDRFRYDPADPVPTTGGALLRRGCGATDQRSVEGRDDVVCYTSPPLDRDLEVAGPVRAVLFAASSAPDTDFTVKLVDVDPAGPALNVCEGIQRARWRGQDPAAKDPVWLPEGEPTRIEVDLWSTACVFRAGHRIRVEVSSSNFPRFDRNPNARLDPAAAAPEEAVAPEQTIFHDAERASHIVLPVRD